ncbi:hypothetical protein LR48_Vigan310s000100 [Vigna angularis]|nr:hypothetical protein LR48_Vigan310s000100 [Vigna angularis]
MHEDERPLLLGERPLAGQASSFLPLDERLAGTSVLPGRASCLDERPLVRPLLDERPLILASVRVGERPLRVWTSVWTSVLCAGRASSVVNSRLGAPLSRPGALCLRYFFSLLLLNLFLGSQVLLQYTQFAYKFEELMMKT